jgi:hypothetical protein
VKRGFETVKIGTDDVRVLVRHQTNHMLPYPLAHYPGLAVVHVESIFQANGRHVKRESLNPPLEFFIS